MRIRVSALRQTAAALKQEPSAGELQDAFCPSKHIIKAKHLAQAGITKLLGIGSANEKRGTISFPFLVFVNFPAESDSSTSVLLSLRSFCQLRLFRKFT